jgi:uncharacterized membrane protein YiaA
MLKFISVTLLMLGYYGVAIDFYLRGIPHLGIAMFLFGIAVYFLFY